MKLNLTPIRKPIYNFNASYTKENEVITMCYILYGSVNNGINMQDYKKAVGELPYDFQAGNEDDINRCIAEETYKYRITYNDCDCDTPVGGHDADNEKLKAFAGLLDRLRDVRGIKYVMLSKNWTGEENEKSITVHIQDTDIVKMLADAEEKCLYRIELYRKY